MITIMINIMGGMLFVAIFLVVMVSCAWFAISTCYDVWDKYTYFKDDVKNYLDRKKEK